MGNVIINKTDATKTARNGSPADEQRGKHPRERAHLDLSRSSKTAESVGVKVSTKEKPAAKTATKSATAKTPEKTTKSTTKKAETKKIAVKSAASESKAVALVTAKTDARSAASNETRAVARTVKPGSKSPKITKYAKNETAVQIIARDNLKQIGAGSKAPKQEMGLVVRSRNIDPELSLMASRSQAMEKNKINSRSSSAGRSMSGMVASRQSANVRNNNVRNTYTSNRPAAKKEPVEETAGFTKVKSALIGVGVALVVAVVGFAGIALFGSNKNICTVQFESNGGSVVEGTEFVCGRTISQPEDPTKDGFTFEGWIFEGDPFDFSTEIYKNATLVAKWKAEEGVEIVVVKFDTDGGSIIKDIEIAKGRKLTPPSAPTKIGYVFEDWYLGDEPFDFSQPVEENITLKAQWERRDSDGGDNSTAKPNNRVTNLTASKTDITLEIGKTETININVLPSSADYSLTAVSSSNAVECKINKTTVTCTAKEAGTANVRVRDVNSGNMTNILVTVPSNDIPPVTDPDPDPEPEPEPTPEPQPDPQPTYYTFTIRFVDTEGNEIMPSKVETLEKGASYRYDAPAIAGYTPQNNFAATDEGGIQGNLTATITYVKDTPAEGGNEGGETGGE